MLRRLRGGIERVRAAASGLRLKRLGVVALPVSHAVHLRPAGAGSFLADGGDPQIHLARPPSGLTGPGFVDFDVEPVGGPLVHPVLYVDRGLGFDDATAIPLEWSQAEGRLVGYVADLAGLRGLRFDPSEAPCELVLRGARLRVTAPSAEDQAIAARTWPGGPLAALNQAGGLDGVIARQIEGLKPTAQPGTFEREDGEARLTLALTPTADAAPFGLLTLDVSTAGALRETFRLHVDYGQGLGSLNAAFAVAAQPDDQVRALIAHPTQVRQVRWDLSGPQARLGFRTIRHAPLGAERLAELVGRDAAEDALRRAEALDDPSSDLEAAILNADLNATTLSRTIGFGHDYDHWTRAYRTPTPSALSALAARDAALADGPSFAFVIPVYNPDPEAFGACLDSIFAQTYGRFQVCVADDASTDEGRTRRLIEAYAAKDARVRFAFRDQNGHISAASNTALALADANYVVLVDQDDVIAPHALSVMARHIVRLDRPAVLYSDEDKIDLEGRPSTPYFKPAFNRYLMFGQNMVSHLGVYRRDLVEAVGGFRVGLEGSQDYDLLLRCLSRCGNAGVHHVPHVLYHWRMAAGSTALAGSEKAYAIDAARRALDDFYRAENLPFRAAPGPGPGLSALDIAAPSPRPALTFVVARGPAGDPPEACMAAIRAQAGADAEIVVVAPAAGEPEPGAFARAVNQAVEAAAGDIVCLIDADLTLTDARGIERAMTLLSLPDTGAVGGRVGDSDGGLRDFGLVLGLGPDRVAATPQKGIPLEDSGLFGRARLIQEVSAVGGACLAMRKALFLEVGGFDPLLRGRYHDVDLCLRLRARGLRVIADPEFLAMSDRFERLEPWDASGDDADLMRRRWAAALADDPFHNPNLTLDRDDRSLASPPRVAPPWDA